MHKVHCPDSHSLEPWMVPLNSELSLITTVGNADGSNYEVATSVDAAHNKANQVVVSRRGRTQSDLLNTTSSGNLLAAC